MEQPIGISRRRAPGKQGGRPVTRSFDFAPYDGDLMPSESPKVRDERVPDDPNHQPSWSWALSKATTERLWVVILIEGDKRPGGVKAEVNRVRASVFTTARRRGTPLVSEYVAPNLYVTLRR